jgi:hypothetical protein
MFAVRDGAKAVPAHTRLRAEAARSAIALTEY